MRKRDVAIEILKSHACMINSCLSKEELKSFNGDFVEYLKNCLTSTGNLVLTSTNLNYLKWNTKEDISSLKLKENDKYTTKGMYDLTDEVEVTEYRSNDILISHTSIPIHKHKYTVGCITRIINKYPGNGDILSDNTYYELTDEILINIDSSESDCIKWICLEGDE